MFKSRKTAVRKCKESRRPTVRSGEKRYKLEENSNITSNRVTIPPGFLCLGVKSRTVRKEPTNENFGSVKDHILNENLYALFNNNSSENRTNLRRSSRLSKRTQNTENYDSVTASDYYLESFNNKESTYQVQEQKKPGCVDNSIETNNSKSLFREINERYTKVKAKESANFNFPISAVVDPDSNLERFHGSSFCRNLSREICVDLKGKNFLLDSKQAIVKKIKEINNKLCGNMNPETFSLRTAEKMEICDEVEQPSRFQLVPRCDWIFETPPRQRVVLPKVEECAIQPAVIHTTRKQSNIYELNPNVKVDLTKYDNRQNIEVDRRYLRHLASFEGNDDANAGFCFDNLRGLDQAGVPDAAFGVFENAGTKRSLGFPDSSTVSQHFARVTCRPSKTVKKKSRITGSYNRKGEEAMETTPTGVNLFQSVEEYERDFTFVEDDGTYRIVNSQSSTRENTFEFRPRKNLFDDGQKFFNFDNQESKMFDFSKLGRN